jgi:pimeloyl-ACP methyl ester carboxylesterase
LCFRSFNQYYRYIPGDSTDQGAAMKWHRKCAGTLGVLAWFAAAPTLAAESSGVTIDSPAYTHSQQRVEVAPGRHLNLYCVGKGSPTVILETGMGVDAGTWGFVQPAVARHTRTCAYDRAGLGFSDPADRPGTAANAVDDLHHLLAAAGIKPPYVLVGHSYGGMIVRLYADLHPRDVAGMVLVDTMREDWPKAFWRLDPAQADWQKTWDDLFSDHSNSVVEGQKCVEAARSGELAKAGPLHDQCIPPPFPTLSKAVNDAYAKQHESVGYQAASVSEDANGFAVSAEQVRATRRWYGAMPLVVLVPSYPAVMPKNVPPDETQAHWTAETHAMVAMDDEMAALSTKGEVRHIDNTMHYIQLQQPAAVVKAVLDVLAATAAVSTNGQP